MAAFVNRDTATAAGQTRSRPFDSRLCVSTKTAPNAPARSASTNLSAAITTVSATSPRIALALPLKTGVANFLQAKTAETCVSFEAVGFSNFPLLFVANANTVTVFCPLLTMYNLSFATIAYVVLTLICCTVAASHELCLFGSGNWEMTKALNSYSWDRLRLSFGPRY